MAAKGVLVGVVELKLRFRPPEVHWILFTETMAEPHVLTDLFMNGKLVVAAVEPVRLEAA
jgi:hypothetical protein